MENFHDYFGRFYGLAVIDILLTLLLIPIVLYILKLKVTLHSISKMYCMMIPT